MSKEMLKAHFQNQIAVTKDQIDKSKLEKNRLLRQRKLDLLTSLQRYVDGTPTREDAILADVINDMMQSLPLLARSKSFRDL